MTNNHDENWVRATLRTDNDPPGPDRAALLRVREATMMIYDNAVQTKSPGSAEVAPLIYLSPLPTQPQHKPRFKPALLATAAASLAVIAFAVLFARGGDTNIQTPGVQPTVISRPTETSTRPSAATPNPLGLDLAGLDSVTVVDSTAYSLNLRVTDPSSGIVRTVTAIEVAEWGAPLAVEGNLKLRDVTSLVDWLAGSDTDQSSLLDSSVTGSNSLVQTWRVLLNRGAAEAVGCGDQRQCGPIATTVDGTTISLIPDMLNEVVVIESPGRPSLLMHVALVLDTIGTEPFLGDLIELASNRD
jgi:hypothetical protein